MTRDPGAPLTGRHLRHPGFEAWGFGVYGHMGRLDEKRRNMSVDRHSGLLLAGALFLLETTCADADRNLRM